MEKKPSGRLIVTYKCLKDCEGCCNKGWKYAPPKIINRLDYEEILITGGEPLLYPDKLYGLVSTLRYLSDAKIYVYTTHICDWIAFKCIGNDADGMTLTIHDDEDADHFNRFVMYEKLWLDNYVGSLRLNVFQANITTALRNTEPFKVKHVRWIKDCPLPPNEELLRLKHLW